MTLRAAVTGLGAVSGFGAGVDPLWAALIEGRRALRPRPELGPDGTLCPLALCDVEPFGAPERAVRLARTAAAEALADALFPLRGPRFGLVCGTTLGGIQGWLPAVSGGAAAPRWNHAGPAQALAAELGVEGPVQVASVACASANVALGVALDLIRQGRCDLVLAGGVDVLHDFVIQGFGCLRALDPLPCRPFDRTRRGLNLGEGACFLLLEAEPHARARGARIRAFVDGAGLAADAVHMTGPDAEGRGAARAMTAALADARARADEVGFVSAHGTATVFNDLMEAKALALALGPHASSVPVNSVKSALGHTLGAAGALEALVCVRSLETGLLAPTPGLAELDPEIALDVVRDRPRDARPAVALSTSSGFGGTNAALVLRRA